MGVYYILFSVLLFFTIIELCGHKWGASIKILLAVLLIVISGFRFEVGNDYNNYVLIFNDPVRFAWMEPGFRLINGMVRLLGLNVQAFFLITSILVIAPLAFTINKCYPRYYCTALAVYVLTYIYFEGMNTVRQAISMTIMFICFCNYITNPKILRFIIYMAIASLFHYSAILIGITGFLMLHYTGKNIKVLFFAVALIASFLFGMFINSFTAIIDDLATVAGYAGYMNKFEQRGVASGFFQYALNLYAVFVLLFAHNKQRSLTEIDKSSVILFITAVVVYNLFINFYIGLRLYWYFYLFIAFAIPAILSLVKKGVSRTLVFFLIMSVFVAYTIVSLDSSYYSPFQFSFDLVSR